MSKNWTVVQHPFSYDIKLRWRGADKKKEWQEFVTRSFDIDFMNPEDAMATIKTAAEDLEDARVDVSIVSDYGSDSIVSQIEGWLPNPAQDKIDAILQAEKAYKLRIAETERDRALRDLERIRAEHPELLE